MQHSRFDVIVVGGGPAGITAAASLSRSGFSVLVCEAAVYPGAENWSGAVYFAENLERPDTFGAEVIERAPWERRLIERGFFLYNGHSLLGGALRDPQVFRSCYTVLRPVFDRYLAEISREYGVVLAAETTVQSLIRHRGRVVGVHTERGPAYADVVFLAEGDASHLVTQEGYEKVGGAPRRGEDGGAERGSRVAEGGPHFLQGVKEVVTLPEGELERRFGLPAGGGAAYEMLLRNGSRRGRTVRLNMGGFLYTNRDSISLGFVLPIDNLARHFDGDHNLLMEWFKGLPEVARWIDGGEVTSYGAKIIRGGGFREIPRLVDEGLAVGGAASGVGLDFPYPNFTGPATAMGRLFARAVREIAAESGRSPAGGKASGDSPYTAEALERAYLQPMRRTHYWRNVERLADWPGYIERTQVFFERQIDAVNGAAYILSRPDMSAPRRWWEAVKIQRRALPLRKAWDTLKDMAALSRGLKMGQAAADAAGAGVLLRWILNTITALLPLGSARTGGDEHTGAATAPTAGGGQFRLVHRVMVGEEPAGRAPWLARWYWRRFGTAVAGAFSDVYTNDDEPLDDKLTRALYRLIRRLSVWDLLVGFVLGVAAGVTGLVQAGLEWFQYRVLERDLASFREQFVARYQEGARQRLRLDDDAVEIRTPYEHKLGTIRYREGEHSHIKVLWPDDPARRREIAASPLWSVCPARVYEVHHHSRGLPGLVINFDNCVKCETCWRATPDVHWSRATSQRLIYETYSPTHGQLREHLLGRPEPRPRLRREQPAYWTAYWGELAGRAAAAAAADDQAARSLAAVDAELQRLHAALDAYGQALADSPLALSSGPRRHLDELVDAVARRFGALRSTWEETGLQGPREAWGGAAAAVLADAAERVEEMQQHALAGHHFWARVVGQQLADHHLAGLRELVDATVAGLPAVAPSAVGLPGDAAGAWSWSLGWRRVEARRDDLRAWREGVAAWCDEHLDAAAIRALEEGKGLAASTRDGLLSCLAGLEEGATSTAAAEWVDPARSATPVPPAHGRRDALLEELAGRDLSLALVASSHLLACDLLEGVEDGEAGRIAAELRAGRALAAVVHQGSIGNRPVDAGGHAGAAVRADAREGVELHGEAPWVPAGAADWLLVVREGKGYLVPADAPGLTAEEPGTIGLVGAGIRRLALHGCVVDGERVVDLGGSRPELAEGAPPTAGEPCADLLRLGVGDHLAMVRGAGHYLLERARDHAGSRVQFPDSFQDEAGRDTIAKFGAVKQMLAEMEARRVLVESVTLVEPGSPDDPWLAAAVRKVLSADALGPAAGSFSYNTGQVFGGTAYSEDDVIAKFYRDSAPFRFLLAHDDALRVAVGRRRLAARQAGGTLVPVTDGEAAWLDEAAGGPLSGAVEAFREAVEVLEERAARLVAEAGGDEVVHHRVGDAVTRALGVKACLLRAAWRLSAGLPSEAFLDAVRLLTDRLVAEAPGLLEEASLLSETVAVGAETASVGDLEPAPRIDDAGTYADVLASDRKAESGDWLVLPFDGDSPRYVPEVLWNDPELREFRVELEQELRARWVEPAFDGLPYGRYLEKIHMVPAEDLDYLRERGFLRMPIPEALGGEEAFKAAYYILCEMTGRYGDAAVSLAIMANTSIGTTPTLIGLEQDLPRVRAELHKVRDDETILGEIATGLDRLITGLARPDMPALQKGYLDLVELVKKRIVRSSVLKYIGSAFLRAFFAAGQAGEQRDLDGFGEFLRRARELLDEFSGGIDERLEEYPRRERAHETFLKMISAGYISAFALTEPTAGSDSGGVKTTARLASRRVHRDPDGVLWFWLDEENEQERRNLLDADRLEFDYEDHRILYRWSDDAPAAVIDHSGYDYDKDRPGHWRTYRHGDREVEFTDIAQIRTGDDGQPVYEFWEMSGAKMWITNGRFAQCCALYARTEPEGVTGFMVDRHAEGLVVGADEEKLGQRGSPTNELSLNQVRVPRENVIGFRGRGQVNALETLNTGRAGLAVTTRATLQEMVEDAVDWLAGLEPRPLERYWMGRLTEEVVATTAVSGELIGLLDHPGTKGVRMESAIGKYYGSEAEHDGIDWMERLRGLDGLTHRHRIEKTRRDARVLNIYEGTNEVQRFLLLRDLLQRVLPAARKRQEAGAAEAAPRQPAHADLVADLEAAKERLLERLDEASRRHGNETWANVSLQPVFFRLSEMAGLIKVMDAVLYRMEWAARHAVPEEFRARLERASRLAFRRSLGRLETVERLYARSCSYLADGRYPPEVTLGFLSLDPAAAAAEAWGRVPERLRPAPERPPLEQELRIAVALKPVPVVAPRPRLADTRFAEALYEIDAGDRRALETALALKARDPGNVRVQALAVEGLPGIDAVREALARGADAAVLLPAPDSGGDAVLHDPVAMAELLAGALGARPADLVLCGDEASDTGQDSLAPYLAGRLGWDHYGGVDRIAWSDDDSLRVGAAPWKGQEIELSGPSVLAMTASGHRGGGPRLEALVAAWAAELERLPRTAMERRVLPVQVSHAARTAPAGEGTAEIVDTPEDAARLLVDLAGLSGGVSGAEATPFEGEILPLGQQPQDDESAACLFVSAPRADGAGAGALEAAARMAGGLGLALDVVVPVESSGELSVAAGQVLATCRPRRIYLIEHPAVKRFTWRGHLEWLHEFWGMYRGRPEWLLGPSSLNDTLARFAGQGAPGVDRCYPWFDVEWVGNGGEPVRVGTEVLDGAARAEARLPRRFGLRVVTFAGTVAVELGDSSGEPRHGDGGPASGGFPAGATGGDGEPVSGVPGGTGQVGAGLDPRAMPDLPSRPAVFSYRPQLDYDPDADPEARLLASLGGGELTLRQAEYVVDLGYGAGGREGLEELAEPLRRLLVEELGLESTMIGGTRKVTQDLEVLPMDRQIGQTGVRVAPKVLLALAVSGAPQHVDWIDEATVIVSFNIDPDAPLMRLAEQRPRPVVHPVLGDVWETVPRFMEALRKALDEVD